MLDVIQQHIYFVHKIEFDRHNKDHDNEPTAITTSTYHFSPILAPGVTNFKKER